MKREPPVRRSVSEPGKVEYRDIERMRGPRSNAGCFVIVFLLAVMVGWYFWKGKPVVARLLHPNYVKAEPTPIEEPRIPGVDFESPSGDTE